MFSKFAWKLIRFFAKDPDLVELATLRARHEEINIKRMLISAELSEARETLREWKIEIERVADQRGHNLCFIDLPRLFDRTIGYRGGYPDFAGVTRPEFEAGCRAYQDQLFGPKPVRPPE
jgi:hypothetical protein